MRQFALFLAVAGLLPAQSLSVGVRGGAPILDAFHTIGNRFESIPHRYTFGPTFEVRLPANFGINFDILYQRLEYSDNGESKKGSQWEFPLMLRKRFGGEPAQPFLAAGVAFNRLSGLAIRDPAEFVKTFTTGVVFGGGVELRLPVIRVAPEVRYTHRFDEQFRISNLISARDNQLTFLVGVTF
ncbi:MAG: hypothetical protein R2729_25310 [Bryobacteraceae bacterium]